MLNSSVFLLEPELSVKWRGFECGTYTSRARILIVQESLNGHPGHLEGIPLVLCQVPQL